MSAFVVGVSWDQRTAPDLTPALELLIPGAAATHQRLGERLTVAHVPSVVAPDARSVVRIPPSITCVADARLDHREELVSRLGEPIDLSRASDVDLIAAAYARWEDGCLEYLRGDFAFIVWDEARLRLFGAADPVGARSLRYSQGPRSLVIGSRTRAVARCSPGAGAIDLPTVREYIVHGHVDWASRTVYRDVTRLPPGYALIGGGGGVRLRRYCCLADGAAERFECDDDYVQRYRELLVRSVRSCLRAPSPVAATLSGGLDSSSVVSLACAESQVGGPIVRAYGLTFPRTPPADESAYQKAVAEQCPGLTYRAVDADDLWAYCDVPGDEFLDEPDVWGSQRPMFGLLARQAAADGARVLLTGNFSDEALGSRAAREFIGSAPVAQWWPEARRMWRVGGWRYPMVEVASGVALRFGGSRGMLGRMGPLARPSLGSVSADLAYAAALSSSRLLTRAWLQRLGDGIGVEFRFPFLDRDLLEFCLRLPPDVRLRGDRVSHKYVLRESMRAVLPETLLSRRGTANFDHLLRLGLMAQHAQIRQVADHGAVLGTCALPSRTVAEVRRAARALQGNRRSEKFPGGLAILSRMLDIENLLRTQEAGKWQRRTT